MKFEKNISFKQYLSKDLIEFLEKENLMDYVDKESKKQWTICNNHIEWNNNSYPIPINIVSCLFLWKITKQGNDFWANIGLKYDKFLDNKYPF